MTGSYPISRAGAMRFLEPWGPSRLEDGGCVASNERVVRESYGSAPEKEGRQLPSKLGSYCTERRVEVVVRVTTTRRGLPPDDASPGRMRTIFLTERLM